jgi:hypothetical protein
MDCAARHLLSQEPRFEGLCGGVGRGTETAFGGGEGWHRSGPAQAEAPDTSVLFLWLPNLPKENTHGCLDAEAAELMRTLHACQWMDPARVQMMLKPPSSAAGKTTEMEWFCSARRPSFLGCWVEHPQTPASRQWGPSQEVALARGSVRGPGGRMPRGS